MIGKLVNGILYPCPRQGLGSDKKLHTNLPAFYAKHLDAAVAAGYFPVQYTEKPDDGDYTSSWTLQNGKIVQMWTPYTPELESEIT